MLVPTASFMQNLAHLQAQIAQDRVTGEDDAAIAACGELLEYLAGYPTGQDDPQWWADAPVEQRAELAARADRTLAMIRATGEAPRAMRSIAATQFLDLGRQEGLDLQVPGEEE